MPEPNSGCLLWTGWCDSDGYGYIQKKRKTFKAHRLSWEQTNGPIPPGMLVCHKCDVPGCINPNHLFLGTPLDNMLDKGAKGRGNPALGERHGASKLTDDKVRAILADDRYYRIIAAEYGVDTRTISRIKRREMWRHVRWP